MVGRPEFGAVMAGLYTLEALVADEVFQEIQFVPLITRRLILRPFEARDLGQFTAYRRKPEVARFQNWERFTEEDARLMLAEQEDAVLNKPGHGYQLVLETLNPEVLIGDCYFQIPVHESRQAEIGFNLDPAWQGKGYMAEGLARLLDYLFFDLNKHRVYAVTDAENYSAANLLERLKFRREAEFRQNLWFKGRWGDEFLYAMLEDEWPIHRPRG